MNFSEQKAIRIARDRVAQPQRRQESTYAAQNLQLIGKILSSSPIAGATNRWVYTWRKADVDSTASTPDYLFSDSDDAALNGQALNVLEGGNTGATLMPGVTIANLPTGFTVGPVATGCYVLLTPKRLKDGAEMYFFCVPNPIDGECQEGA